jgi:hypothetical protein
MGKYATGKYAKAISDRSGMEFPYREMVREWNGAFVHVSEYEPKQPQLEPKPNGADGIALLHVRTDRIEPATTVRIPDNGLDLEDHQLLLRAQVVLFMQTQQILMVYLGLILQKLQDIQ